MPRTNLCSNQPRMRLTIGQYLTGAMHGICTQAQLAEKMGITQQSLSVKLRKNQFDLPDFQIVVRELQLSDEEIISLVRRGNFKEKQK